MRKRLFEFADCLELVFLSPLKYISEWESRNLNWKLYSKFILVGSALSLSVGTSYISPPYTKGFIVGILLATIVNILILLIIPLFMGSILDYRAQGRLRKGNSPMMVDFIRVGLSTFMLYAPLCILFKALGFYGLGGSFFALILIFSCFALVISRGVKYIYDLKDRDSIRFAIFALSVSMVYPFLFNFYMTSYILNFTL